MYTFTNINTNTITKANESNITNTATIITARWQACWHTTVHVTHWALSLQERKLLCFPMQVYMNGIRDIRSTWRVLYYPSLHSRKLQGTLSMALILLFFTTKFTITSTVLTILANKFMSVQLRMYSETSVNLQWSPLGTSVIKRGVTRYNLWLSSLLVQVSWWYGLTGVGLLVYTVHTWWEVIWMESSSSTV